jgi:HAD superfamily hydrolase (TIGR01457 family)
MSAPRPQLSNFRSLVIDIDGVLWKGQEALPGVPEFFDFLRRRAIPFIIASNNSARPASDIIERLALMNVRADPSEVLTSAEATAKYLPRLIRQGSRVYVVGGQGINDALRRAGFGLVDRNADAVVVGIDPDLTYEKLKRATFEIRRGAKFIGTNADKTYPTDEGIVPGAGAILAAIQTATDVVPIIIGKPERAMFDIAVEQMQADPATCAMLGDRLDTDIQGARNAGLLSILVMTGITTHDTLEQSQIKPDFIFENLDSLRAAWLASK